MCCAHRLRIKTFYESINVDNVFYGNWTYSQLLGDGGVIGTLGGDAWSVTIDQISYFNIDSLMAYGLTNYISLDLDTNKDITFTVANNPTPAPVPEPATMFLFGIGLAGLGGVKLTRKNK